MKLVFIREAPEGGGGIEQIAAMDFTEIMMDGRWLKGIILNEQNNGYVPLALKRVDTLWVLDRDLNGDLLEEGSEWEYFKILEQPG